ncbi:Bifunctional deaminase-reductase domain protein [Flavobacteriaceae bacterium 3519-10]|nr:Bifunctional deaminase-reductase domain protein [Flavobacteriaceae bacterium 3519-10]
MRKITAAINMTLDGYCDHTAISPGAEIHQHYTELLRNADTILYGRITYQLMEFWKTLAEKPSGVQSMDDFAEVMSSITKIVFSHTLKNVDWDSAQHATQSLESEVRKLTQQPGKDILVGSRSLIMQLIQLNLLDELQLMVHPVIAGSGLPLFEQISKSTNLELADTKRLGDAVILYYTFPLRHEV